MNRLSPDQGTLGERLDDIDGSGNCDEEQDAPPIRKASLNAPRFYRKKTVEAQRVSAECSARARSYLAAAGAYRVLGQLPAPYHLEALHLQEQSAWAHQRARLWVNALDAIQ